MFELSKKFSQHQALFKRIASSHILCASSQSGILCLVIQYNINNQDAIKFCEDAIREHKFVVDAYVLSTVLMGAVISQHAQSYKPLFEALQKVGMTVENEEFKRILSTNMLSEMAFHAENHMQKKDCDKIVRGSLLVGAEEAVRTFIKDHADWFIPSPIGETRELS